MGDEAKKDPPANPGGGGQDPPANPGGGGQDPPANPGGVGQDNDAKAQRRIIETLQQSVKDLTAQVQALKPKDPPADPKDPPAKPGGEGQDPPDAVKALQEQVEQMRQELRDARLAEARERIAREKGVPATSLRGDTAEALAEHADVLAADIKKVTEAAVEAAKKPGGAGTVTNPDGAKAPTLDQQIEEARKAGNKVLELNLVRKKAREIRAKAAAE